MSDLSTLESRITAAMERIRAGVASGGGAASDGGALAAQLDEERMANAQLEERVKALKSTQDGTLAKLEAKTAAQAGQLEQLETELQRLRAANADMREMSVQLRSAAARGVAEPELINRAMMAEIEALTAQRGADAAEMEAILGQLTPLWKEADHAAG